jgi:hypothetical protein
VAQAFAQVAFTWESAPECSIVHTGSQIDYRAGAKFPPGSPASPEHTRLVTLG